MTNLVRLIVFVAVALIAPGPRSLQAVEAPPSIRLVLLVAVDQCRYDYLTRFRSDFSGGLARLLTSGAVFSNAYLDHYPTVTAVGHSTMLSGATPAISGIIGNDWYDRTLGRNVTSVSDPAVTLVGGTGEGSSPRRLLVSTVGDELKSASRAADGSPNRPKVFGLSLKDRSAILPAGHMADGAYWFDTVPARSSPARSTGPTFRRGSRASTRRRSRTPVPGRHGRSSTRPAVPATACLRPPARRSTVQSMAARTATICWRPSRKRRSRPSGSASAASPTSCRCRSPRTTQWDTPTAPTARKCMT